MKTLLLVVSALSLGALASTASAEAQTWQGAYVGGSVNFGSLAHHSDTVAFDTNLDGTYGDTVHPFSGGDYFSPGFCQGYPVGNTAAAGCRKSHNQVGLAARAGYDWQSDHLVYGLVAEATNERFQDAVTAFSTAPDSYTFTRRMQSLWAVRGRVGYATGKWLLYGTAGFASGDVKRSFITTNALNTFTASDGRNDDGTQVGLGVEKRCGDWSIGLEYLRTSLKDRGATVRASGNANTFASNPFLTANSSGTNIRWSGDKFDMDSVLVAVSYRFGGK